MWMPWNPIYINSYVRAAEDVRITENHLNALKYRRENGDNVQSQQAPTTNQSSLVQHLRKIEGIPLTLKFRQNSLCDYCSSFLLRLLAENCRIGDLNQNPQSLPSNSDRLIYHNPRTRSISAVIKSTFQQDCWICDHVFRNVRSDGAGTVKTGFTSLHALDFTPDTFTVAGHGPKEEYSFLIDFQISPAKGDQDSNAPHRVFDVMNRVADSISPDRALAALLDLGEGSDPPVADPWPSDGVEKALTWLQTCEKDHVGCRRFHGDISAAAYPSRVLDLSRADDGVIKLVTGDKLRSEHADYATLSHCWGNVRQAILLKANLEAYQRGIDIKSLPQTFIDAVKVCTDLKIKYLWIDSLCIIQDDKQDWAFEAPRMAEVYTNSRITLAATASYRDADGLFNLLDPALVSPLVFSLGTDNDDDGNQQYFRVQTRQNFGTYVNEAPLNKRAWVLQERALSRRILHFANDQLYWQCATGVQAQYDIRYDSKENFTAGGWESMMQWSDSIPNSLSDPRGAAVEHDQGRLKYLRSQPTDHPLLSKWDDLVQSYSPCHLTYNSDKLIAISGLAKRVLTITSWPGSDYLAGLWRQGLPRRLIWSSNEPSRQPPNPGIPSWSWAHLNEGVFWPQVIWTENGESTGTIVAELLSASTSPTETALGSVTGGQLTLRAPLCRIKLYRSLLAEYHIGAKVHQNGKWVQIASVMNENVPLDINFDLKTSWAQFFGREIVFMPILYKIYNSEHDKESESSGKVRHMLFGLMLQPTGLKNGQYRRVGFLGVEPDAVEAVQTAMSTSRLSKRYFVETDKSKSSYVLELV